MGDALRYDLIIDDGATLSRVQVKTGRLVRGAIAFNCFSTHLYDGKITERPYRGQVEFIGVFCPDTGGVSMVPESDLVNSKMSLRVARTANGQDRHVRWASRYKLV